MTTTTTDKTPTGLYLKVYPGQGTELTLIYGHPGETCADPFCDDPEPHGHGHYESDPLRPWDVSAARAAGYARQLRLSDLHVNYEGRRSRFSLTVPVPESGSPAYPVAAIDRGVTGTK